MAYTNIEDRKAYHRKWYAENRAHRVKQISDYQDRVRKKVAELKMERGCAECGYNKCARALEFHHNEGESKEFSIGGLRRNGRSWQRVLAEVEKCTVLCSNCHRELHDALDKAESAGVAQG